MRLFCAVLALASAVCVLRAADDENPFKVQLSGWSFSRERKTITGSNRVTATLTAKNTSREALRDVKIVLNYTAGIGEKVAKPVQQSIATLKAGDAQKLSFVAEFVPIFNGYEIAVTYAGGQKEEWYSSSESGEPQPKLAQKGVASVVLLSREVSADRSGRFSGTVRVKNEGTLEAKGVKLTITFFDMKKQKMSTWSTPLGSGTLAGGIEKNFPIACNAPHNYGGYEMNVGCEDTPAEAALSGGDFTNAKDVEFAQFVFKREPKSKELHISAAVRNGCPGPVDQVKLTLTFFDAKKKRVREATHAIPGSLKPGEIKSFDFTIANMPEYDAFEQASNFNKMADAPAQSGSTKLPGGTFKNISDIEIVFTDAVTNDDHSVTLAGALRNGKEIAVKDINIVVTFSKADGSELAIGERTLTDVVKPGEERNFILRAPKAAGFHSYAFRFKYAELGKR